MRDLRATNLVLGLPWLDDEQASLQLALHEFYPNGWDSKGDTY
jgi:hypothetical protein